MINAKHASQWLLCGRWLTDVWTCVGGRFHSFHLQFSKLIAKLFLCIGRGTYSNLTAMFYAKRRSKITNGKGLIYWTYIYEVKPLSATAFTWCLSNWLVDVFYLILFYMRFPMILKHVHSAVSCTGTINKDLRHSENKKQTWSIGVWIGGGNGVGRVREASFLDTISSEQHPLCTLYPFGDKIFSKQCPFLM